MYILFVVCFKIDGVVVNIVDGYDFKVWVGFDNGMIGIEFVVGCNFLDVRVDCV